MTISVLISFVFAYLLAINNLISQDLLLVFGTLILAFGTVCGLLRRSSVGFYAICFALGMMLFFTADNRFIDISHNLVPPQSAIINGEVCQILSQSPGKQRLIIEGTIDAKYLPPLTNTKALLTVSGNKKLALGSSIVCKGSISVPARKVLPADFDELSYLHNYGASVKCFASAKNVIAFPPKKTIKNFTNKVASSIEYQIDTLFSAQSANFVKAILLANKSELDTEIKRNFQIAGVAHILAVSGFHLGVISVIIWLLLSFFPINRWLKFAVFCFAVLAFCALTNLQPSVLRASAMAIIFVLGKTMQRQTNWLNVVSIVILATIICYPELLFSVSFQLSLLSVLGIFMCYNVFYKALSSSLKSKSKIIPASSGISNYLKSSIAITLSTSIVITPLVVYYFNMFSVISPLTNIIVIPIFSILLVFAVLAICVSFIAFPLGEYYAYNVEILTNWCYKIVEFASNFQYSSIATNNVLLSVAFAVLLFYCALASQKRQLLFRLSVSFSIAIMLFYLQPNDSINAKKTIAPSQIYVKYNYNLLCVPLNDGSQFVWLADKKPNTKYYNDIGLIQYFRNNNIKYIGINGSFGKTFVEKNCQNKQYVIRQLSFPEQQELEKRYLEGKHISQIMR